MNRVDDALDRLGKAAGILPGYWDIAGTRHQTSPDTTRALLAAMGLDTSTPAALQDALDRLARQRRATPLKPMTVVRTDPAGNAGIPITLPARIARLNWQITTEAGDRLAGDLDLNDAKAEDTGAEDTGAEDGGTVDGERLVRRRLPLPAHLGLGYHALTIDSDGITARGRVAIAPPHCHWPAWLAAGDRLWGVTGHLYSLRSDRDWGIGDLGDLSRLVELVDRAGGSAVGLNPLHALFPGRPERASPYAPSSRLWLNPLYLDIAAVPGFADCPVVQDRLTMPELATRLDAVRATDLVRYDQVAALKQDVLALLFDWFETHADPRPVQDFQRRGGPALERFAVFNAIAEETGDAPPPPPRDASMDRLGEAAARRARRHVWLQWLCDRQLAAAADTAGRQALAVGLYRDLAVGAHPHGAEVWAQADIFAQGARFGAPPDAFTPDGQDWGMPPYDPLTLAAVGYQPFIDLIRTNMAHAGALRIDHAMWLDRLFWIPPGGAPADGAYVRYPVDDLAGLVALESTRAGCLVVGEDLGTVPEGFRQRMAGERILSTRVLPFERHEDGLFKRPETYPRAAVCQAGTHDLPTVRGFWQGWDIAVREDMAGRPDAAARRHRARDRQRLLAALADQGLLLPDLAGRPPSEAQMRQLILAVHRFLARTPAALMLVALDDVLAVEAALNLPGTTDEYANWRRRLPETLERLAQEDDWWETAYALNQERGR